MRLQLLVNRSSIWGAEGKHPRQFPCQATDSRVKGPNNQENRAKTLAMTLAPRAQLPIPQSLSGKSLEFNLPSPECGAGASR